MADLEELHLDFSENKKIDSILNSKELPQWSLEEELAFVKELTFTKHHSLEDTFICQEEGLFGYCLNTPDFLADLAQNYLPIDYVQHFHFSDYYHYSIDNDYYNVNEARYNQYDTGVNVPCKWVHFLQNKTNLRLNQFYVKKTSTHKHGSLVYIKLNHISFIIAPRNELDAEGKEYPLEMFKCTLCKRKDLNTKRLAEDHWASHLTEYIQKQDE